MNEKKENRRDFIGNGVRMLAFGGLAAYGAGQVAKGKRLENDPECIRLDTCTQCIELDGCVKPKSVSFRDHYGIESKKQG